MKLVEINGEAFQRVSDRLKDEFEVAKKAGCPQYASARILDDTAFILSFDINGLIVASDRIKDDKEIVLTVLRDPKRGSGIGRNDYGAWIVFFEGLLYDKEVGLALLELNRESMDWLGHWTDGPDRLFSTNPLVVDQEIVSLSLAPIRPEFKTFTGRYWFSSVWDSVFSRDVERIIFSHGPMRERILRLYNEATKISYINCDPWERIYLASKVAGSIAGHDDDTKRKASSSVKTSNSSISLPIQCPSGGSRKARTDLRLLRPGR